MRARVLFERRLVHADYAAFEDLFHMGNTIA
jgi:hypothetical protein